MCAAGRLRWASAQAPTGCCPPKPPTPGAPCTLGTPGDPWHPRDPPDHPVLPPPSISSKQMGRARRSLLLQPRCANALSLSGSDLMIIKWHI